MVRRAVVDCVCSGLVGGDPEFLGVFLGVEDGIEGGDGVEDGGGGIREVGDAGFAEARAVSAVGRAAVAADMALFAGYAAVVGPFVRASSFGYGPHGPNSCGWDVGFCCLTMCLCFRPMTLTRLWPSTPAARGDNGRSDI